MRKVLGLVVLCILGFYVAWPAYTGYAIKSALDSDNATLLASKIDFDRLRESLKPAVTAEAEKAATAAIQQGAGANAALLKQLQTQLLPAMVDKLLVDVVTPETVLRLNREGGNYKATLARIIAEKLGGASLGTLLGGSAKTGSGGLGDLIGGVVGKAAGVDPGKALGGLFGGPKPQEPPAPATVDGAPKRSFSLSNIKSFGVNGLLGFSVGVAKDPSASAPDVTADIAFTGFDWKLVGLRPRI